MRGNFDKLTLQAIDEYINEATPNNPHGRRVSERLPQRARRAVETAGGLAAVDALFSRISESAVRPHERTRTEGRRKIEERKKELLRQWAQATGNWHTDLSAFTDDTEPIGSGTDSDVYSSKDGRYVIKASKGKPSGKRFRPDIDNIPLFNSIFTDSPYEILGYGEIDGKFVRILRQPAVDFATSEPLTVAERVDFMEQLGFRPINEARTAFSNGEIIVADLQKSNVVKDANGEIRVIDADVKLHTRDLGGEYDYLPVEHDLPPEVGEDEPGDLYRDPDEDDEGAAYDAGRVTFEESVTGGLLKAASDNRAALGARVSAMRALGGNLSKLRQAMARQREYDRGTVDSIVRLARSVIDSGFFKGFTPYEVKRLMGMVNRAAGREDITKQAGEVVDLLLHHELKESEAMLGKLLSIKGSKVNAKGVEVQGQLDIEGQRMVTAMKDAMALDAEALQERIDDTLDRMGSDDSVIADNAAIEYEGLLFAKQYLEEIKGSESEAARRRLARLEAMGARA